MQDHVAQNRCNEILSRYIFDKIYTKTDLLTVFFYPPFSTDRTFYANYTFDKSYKHFV